MVNIVCKKLFLFQVEKNKINRLPWVKHLLQKIYYPAYDVAFCIAFFSCLELLLPPQLVP